MKRIFKRLWDSGVLPLILILSIQIILLVIYDFIVGLSNINIPLIMIITFIIVKLIIFLA